MEIEFLPTGSLAPETFNILVVPVKLLAKAQSSHPELQRYKIFFISGNYTRILSPAKPQHHELDVRRANTLFQLMTILQENHHSFLIEEHDPLLYEDAERRMVEYLAQALKQTSREAKVLLLHASAGTSSAEEYGAIRPGVLYLWGAGSGQRPGGKGEARMLGDQRMPEASS